jgi:MFS family permease
MSVLTRYRATLAFPGARSFFPTTVVGRLAVAMYSIGVVLMASAHYTSYLQAGLIAGFFAGSEAVGGPIAARFVDTYGQRRVLPPLAFVHLVGVAALILVVSRPSPVPLAVAIAVVAGASVPQFGALAAARWSRLLKGRPEIETAFSMEAVANDCVFIVGPSAAATLVALMGSKGGVIVAASLAITAAVLLSRLRRTEPLPDHTDPAIRRQSGYRTQPWLIIGGVCALNVVLGLTFGSTQLSVAALSRSVHHVALAGVLYTTMSVGSLLSSLSYGSINWRIPIWLRLSLAAVVTGMGALIFVVSTVLPLHLVALFVMGIGIGPLIVLGSVILQRSVGETFLTQSFALAGASSAVGIALAGVSGGAVIDSYGFRGGMQFVMAIAALNALIGVAMRGLLAHSPGGTATEQNDPA